MSGNEAIARGAYEAGLEKQAKTKFFDVLQTSL